MVMRTNIPLHGTATLVLEQLKFTVLNPAPENGTIQSTENLH